MKIKEIPLYLRKAKELKKIPAARLGITETGKTEVDVLISLTSIRHRLAKLHLVIRSLLLQSVQAEKILLWLHHDLAGELPQSLTSLIGPRFEIHYTNEHSPHRKLTETLRNFSKRNIVTCDDDMLYPSDWLSRLIDDHDKHPDEIIAHECRKISTTDSGDIRPYLTWVKETPGASHSDTISVGYGGVFYPAGSLPDETLDKDTYLRLTPSADDLWFKAMSLMSGTRIRRSSICEPMPIQILGSQKVALKHKNIKEDRNRAQWLDLIKEFNISV